MIEKRSKIIADKRGSGKTKKLLEYAADNNLTIYCKNPERLRVKAAEYGIHGLGFRSYEDSFEEKNSVAIDDIETFLRARYGISVGCMTVTTD